jgi:glycosyltransferase involved in cell wall biosynthesis
MKVAIFSPEIGRTNGGKGQYAFYLLSHLCPLLYATGCQVHILVAKDACLDGLAAQVRVFRLPVSKNTGTWRVVFEQVYWGADVFLSLNSLFPLAPIHAARKLVVVHDIVQLQDTAQRQGSGGRILSKSLLYGRIAMRKAISESDTIITVSQSVAAEVEAHFRVTRNRIVAIRHGLDHKRFHPVHDPVALEGVRKRYSLPPSFYLFVGPPHDGKKNLSLIARTYAQFKGDDSVLLPVVIVGGERDSKINDQDSALIRDSAQTYLFRYLGFVPDEDLPLLYASARALLHPAHHEGFGFPPLEAMGCGTPVVASDRASIPEVVGNAAILIDPCNPASLHEALHKVNEESARASLIVMGLRRAQGFSWGGTAELMAEQILQTGVSALVQ